MKIENSFTVEAPFAQAWAHLTDISALAACLPGVVMHEQDDGVYTGSVKSKVGPVTAEYRSSAHFVERNENSGRAVLDASGRDSRTEGNVRMLVTASIVGAGAQTRVQMSTEVTGTGKVAQLGRGVMQTVSEKLLAQFVACTNATLAESDATAAPADAPAGITATTADDHEALDLLDAAGGAVAKRVVPVAIVALVVIAILLYVL